MRALFSLAVLPQWWMMMMNDNDDDGSAGRSGREREERWVAAIRRRRRLYREPFLPISKNELWKDDPEKGVSSSINLSTIQRGGKG